VLKPFGFALRGFCGPSKSTCIKDPVLSVGHLINLPCWSSQAMQLLKLGIGGFLFDFWTWFFDGNCATYIQALPNFTSTINGMPNLGYRRVLH
jgi:hypothetical protein